MAFNDKSPLNFLSPSSNCNSMMYLCEIWVKGWLRYLQSLSLHNFNVSRKKEKTSVHVNVFSLMRAQVCHEVINVSLIEEQDND